jgi:hypothetical protein
MFACESYYEFMKTEQPEPVPLVPGEDYYVEDGLFIMTAAYHKKRGSCCGNRCKWCPFKPRYELGTTQLATDQRLLPKGETTGYSDSDENPPGGAEL